MSTDQDFDPIAASDIVQEFMHPIRDGRRSPLGTTNSWAASRPRNRRRAKRVCLVSTDVVVTIEAENVSVIDLSVNGIQLRTNNRMAPGSSVMLQVHWRDTATTSLALGRVMWSIYEKPPKFSYAHYRVGALLEHFDIATFRRVAQRYGLAAAGPTVEVVDHRW